MHQFIFTIMHLSLSFFKILIVLLAYVMEDYAYNIMKPKMGVSKKDYGCGNWLKSIKLI